MPNLNLVMRENSSNWPVQTAKKKDRAHDLNDSPHMSYPDICSNISHDKSADWFKWLIHFCRLSEWITWSTKWQVAFNPEVVNTLYVNAIYWIKFDFWKVLFGNTVELPRTS